MNALSDSIVLHVIGAHRPLGYALTFLGMLIEGDTILFAVAFLTHRGLFRLWPMVTVICSGVFLGDLLWYWLGKRSGQASPLFRRWIARGAILFDRHLQQRPFRTIFLSKFTYGFNRLVLVRAGASGLPVAGFLRSDTLASFFWVLTVGGFGFFSSASFSLVKRYLKFAELALLAGIVLLLLFEYLTRRSMTREGTR